MQGLVSKLRLKHETIHINYDSHNVIRLSTNQVYHGRTKHIDIILHYIRYVIQNGDAQVVKIHTSENPADMLTKFAL